MVLVSHSHYDHLEDESIERLAVKSRKELGSLVMSPHDGDQHSPDADNTPNWWRRLRGRKHSGTRFVAPTGIADIMHNNSGVERRYIAEMGWWEKAQLLRQQHAEEEEVVSRHVHLHDEARERRRPIQQRPTDPRSPEELQMYENTNHDSVIDVQQSVSSTVPPISAIPPLSSHTGRGSGGAGDARISVRVVGDSSTENRAIGGSAKMSTSTSSRGRAGDAVSSFNDGGMRVTCVPAQHYSNRGIFDRNVTLWGGFVVEAGDHNLYFAGDTGYRKVDKNGAPIGEACPVFKEIGERCGPMDLSLLPIGAYSPRAELASVHASPADAVAIHRDVKSRKSIGMHWGTFALTSEPFSEPPQRLAAAARVSGLRDGELTTMEHGGMVCLGEEV